MDGRGSAVDAECPRCGTSAVPTGERMITCQKCALVFTPRLDPSSPTTLRPLDLPDGITGTRDGDRIRIVWPFGDALTWVLGGLFVAAPFALAAYFEPVWWAIAMPVAIGVVFAYYVVAHAIGGRAITYDRDAFTMVSRPLPTRPRIHVRRSEISEVVLRLTPDGARQRRASLQLVLRRQEGFDIVVLEASPTTEDAERITRIGKALGATSEAA